MGIGYLLLDLASGWILDAFWMLFWFITAAGSIKGSLQQSVNLSTLYPSSMRPPFPNKGRQSNKAMFSRQVKWQRRPLHVPVRTLCLWIFTWWKPSYKHYQDTKPDIFNAPNFLVLRIHSKREGNIPIRTKWLNVCPLLGVCIDGAKKSSHLFLLCAYSVSMLQVSHSLFCCHHGEEKL